MKEVANDRVVAWNRVVVANAACLRLPKQTLPYLPKLPNTTRALPLFISLTPLPLSLAHQHQLFIHIINVVSIVTVRVFITIQLLHTFTHSLQTFTQSLSHHGRLRPGNDSRSYARG